VNPLVPAAVAAVAYAALGRAVAHAPPDALDRAGRAFAGEATPLALAFTASCWWPVIVSVAAAALVLAVAVPAWRARALTFAITLGVGWQVSDALKNVFARPRPDYWIAIHEPTFAYSSGHAMFAVLVYGVGCWYVARSGWPLAVRLPLAAALAAWACGVIWSRLALGAHFVTDLAGGVLLAIVLLCLGAAVAGRAAGKHPTVVA
jgi:membrane-associated phospholipid phosphatase